MPASERDTRQHAAPKPSGPSMSDLLASCAAASAVSTPPRDPETGAEGPEQPKPRADRPKAA
ncbi:hypothetical protein ACWCP6_04020 [Streptomyces sp. NPDC002004]